MSVQMAIESKTKDLGDSFIVRRALPTVQKRMVGPFVEQAKQDGLTEKFGRVSGETEFIPLPAN